MRGSRGKSGGGFEAANVVIARIVLETPEKFGAEQAGLVQWARLVVAKQEQSELFASGQTPNEATL